MEHNETVVELASQLLHKAMEKNKPIAQLTGALKKLASHETLESPRKVNEAMRALESMPPGCLFPELDLGKLPDVVAADQAGRAAKRKVEFGRTLIENARSAGLTCELVTADPMEFSIAPFTLTVDLEKSSSTLRYARLAIKELVAQPEQILKAYGKSLDLLDSGWDPERFFDVLHEAYQAQLTCKGLAQGERVHLADLLGPVALAYQGNKFLVDPVADNFRSYGRVRFSYDIAHLRRARLLERNEWRINLGPATGTSTRRKENVLYIEDSVGRGQYYLSVWFTRRELGAMN